MLKLSERLGTFGTWMIALGVALVAGGVLALAHPLYTGIGLSMMIGWILLFAAVLYGVGGLTAPNIRRGFPQLLVALLYLAAGLALVLQPRSGVEFLGWLLGLAFLLEGVIKVLTSLVVKELPSRGWMLFSGIVSGALGVLLLARWPVSSAFALGLLVGLNLMFAGFAMITMGNAARAAAEESPPA